MNKTLLLFTCLVYAQIHFGKLMKKRNPQIVHKKVYFNFLETTSAKKDSRNNLHSFLETKRSISPIEDPYYFFNTDYERSLANLPTSGSSSKMPWSSWSYPAKFGYISVRYNLNTKNGVGVFDTQNGNFTKVYNYSESVNSYSQPADYLKTEPSQLQSVIEQNYSPSEKLDFLVGDYNFTLTNYLKSYALQLGDNMGDLQDWMGISNGWAVASQTYDKPINPVTLTAKDGTKVRFLPDDIMAIASMYYATAPSSTNYVGGVCSSSSPNEGNSDHATGLYTDPMCATVNPATLYLILSGAMGLKNLHVSIDPSVGPQVWNNPIYSYKYDFFNIQTNITFSDYKQAKVDFSIIRHINNPFFNFISGNFDNRTISYLGVKFNVNFAVLNFPYHLDYAEPNSNYTAIYEGVIEVDANDNIVGGEWRANYHPNILWKNDERFPPQGCCDNMTDPFNGKVTNTLTGAVVLASSQGQILKSIVDYLVTQSTTITSAPSSNSGNIRNTNTDVVSAVTRPIYNNGNSNSNSNNAYAPISTVSLPNSNTDSSSNTNTYDRPTNPTANSNSNTNTRPTSNTSSNSNSNTNTRPTSNTSSNSNSNTRPSNNNNGPITSYSSYNPNTSSNTNLNSLRNYYGDPGSGYSNGSDDYNNNNSGYNSGYSNGNSNSNNNGYSNGSSNYSSSTPSNFISNTLNNIRRSIDSSDIFSNLFDSGGNLF